MIESTIYLKSLHPSNFRHNIENARVIGFIMLTPENFKPRPSFKVQYDSDNFIGYVTYESTLKGHWKFL